jgi:hypothetical protein
MRTTMKAIGALLALGALAGARAQDDLEATVRVLDEVSDARRIVLASLRPAGEDAEPAGAAVDSARSSADSASPLGGEAASEAPMRIEHESEAAIEDADVAVAAPAP